MCLVKLSPRGVFVPLGQPDLVLAEFELNDLYLLNCTGTSTLLFEMECFIHSFASKTIINNDKSNTVM